MAEGGADGDDDAATASPVQNIYPSYWTPHTVAKFGGAGVALLVAPGAIAGKYFNGEYPSITTASLAGIISGAALAGWNIFGGIWVAMGGAVLSPGTTPMLVAGGYMIPATVWALAAADVKVGAVAGIPAGIATAYYVANTELF